MAIEDAAPPAALDPAHVGDIEGAFGTLKQNYAGTARDRTWRGRLRLLLIIAGPGLIVMGGGNDAGGVETYAQMGQTYGMTLLWTLVLLFPILFICQEMVVRLGAVSGVGHARLIFDRFGRIWGWFSVADLLIVLAVTVVTEFIGVSQTFSYFGLSRFLAVPITAVLLFAVIAGRSYRYWERFLIGLVVLNFLSFPLLFVGHPTLSAAAHGAVPSLPGGLTADLLLFIVAIIGTTVEPWQLFFQQASIVDKRIGPRWIHFERADLGIGIVVEVIGGIAIMVGAAFGLAHTGLLGGSSDVTTIAHVLSGHWGREVGWMITLAMFDGSLIGANLVGLTAVYVLGEAVGTRHSLRWKPRQAPWFYGVYAALVVVSAVIVLMPGNPLGLIIEAVAALNGVLLPIALVFLLLLANDRPVLGPWVNGPWQNAITGVIVWCMVALSLATTATYFFPNLSLTLLAVGLLTAGAVGMIGGLVVWRLQSRRARIPALAGLTRAESKAELTRLRTAWRTPPLDTLEKPVLSPLRKAGLVTLRAYVLISVVLLIIKIISFA